jgi:hypothetical protein
VPCAPSLGGTSLPRNVQSEQASCPCEQATAHVSRRTTHGQANGPTHRGTCRQTGGTSPPHNWTVSRLHGGQVCKLLVTSSVAEGGAWGGRCALSRGCGRHGRMRGTVKLALSSDS